MEANVMVTVICLAYNHEKYIRQALESMFAQKVNFRYEVIVHDDASTDSTTDIIREFEMKYPDILVPIYQKENQYSKGVQTTRWLLQNKARGKYFALCEGDDYWTDVNKLQMQFNYMEAHPECTFCIHNAVRVRNDGKRLLKIAPVKRSRRITGEEVILGGGGYCATNSIFAPMRVVRDLPPFFDFCANDWVWQMYLASFETGYCFQEEMSAYRWLSDGSWTITMREHPEIHQAYKEKCTHTTAGFNQFTNGRYEKVLKKQGLQTEYINHFNQGDFKILRQEPYRSCGAVDRLRLRQKLRLFAGLYCPPVLSFVEWMKNRVKK